MPEPAFTSNRYQLLLRTIEKALTHSRSQLNVSEIIKDCYGDDLNILISSDGDNALLALFESMLDRVHDKVTEGVKEDLAERQIEKMLVKLEKVVETLDQEQARKETAEEWDKESARQALKKASVGKTVPADMVVYATYEKIFKERENLLQELELIERETADLEAQRANKLIYIEQCLSELRKAAGEFEDSADMCSMMS